MMSTGCRILATIGPKGGPGKTTVALTTGLVLAEAPLARPIVVELNPDWGTIDQVLGDANPRTIQDLLQNLTAVNQAGIGLLQGYVTMWGRLPVLTAPSRPDAMARLAPRDYERVLKLLSVHYNLIILDCGTAFTQRLNQFAIQAADHLQVVGWPDHPTLQKTVAAIDYLASSRYAHDYQGVLAELTSDHAAVRARALADMTLVVNGAGFPSGTAAIDLAQGADGRRRPQRRRVAAVLRRAQADARRRDADDGRPARGVPAGRQGIAGRRAWGGWRKCRRRYPSCPHLIGCIAFAHALLVPLAATGDASQMGDFFKKVYEQLLIPVAAPIGILMFTVGAVMFLLGRRDGVEKMLYAGSALFLIAFGPFIVTKLWEILTGLGGGVAH